MQVARPTTFHTSASCSSEANVHLQPISPITSQLVDLPTTFAVVYYSLRLLNLLQISTPHRLANQPSMRGSRHGRWKLQRVLARSPCATAKNLLLDATPRTRYHDYDYSVPRMP